MYKHLINYAEEINTHNWALQGTRKINIKKDEHKNKLLCQTKYTHRNRHLFQWFC